MKRLLAVAAVFYTAAALAVFASVALDRPNEADALNPGCIGPYVVGFDMDPSSEPANTATSIGSVQLCISVLSMGPAFDVDVFIDAVPPDETLDAFGYQIEFNSAHFSVIAQNHALLLMATPGSGPLISGSEAVPDPPDSDGNPQAHSILEWDQGTSEPGGSAGLLGRYTFIATGPPGLYVLELSGLSLIGSGANPDWAFRVTDILDGNYGYGIIAVGTPCPVSADFEASSLEVVYGEDWTGDPSTCADTVDNGGDTLADFADPDCRVAAGSLFPTDEGQFILRENLQNRGSNSGLAKVATTCSAPPGGQCSYHVKAGDSPDGDLEVSVDGGAPEVNPAEGSIFWGDTITVVQRIWLSHGTSVSLDKNWDLQCVAGGTDTWEFQNTVDPDYVYFSDPFTCNDSASASITVECLGDYDGDYYWDADETAKGSEPLDIDSTPEHCDGVDNDGDDRGDGSGVDEGFPDSDGDTVKDCVDPDHPYYTDDDDDDDGFTDEDERWMSTDEQDACPDGSNPWGAENDDAWAPDIDMNTVVDVTDALTFLAAYPSAEGMPIYSRRLDMAGSNGAIDVSDALAFLGCFSSSCTNP